MRFLCFLLLLVSKFAHAQTLEIKHMSRDKAYIKDFYKTHIIFRVYESSRFNNFKLSSNGDKLEFKPNHHNDLGLGFTYKIISVDFEFYIPPLGQNNGYYGITHSFDLQTYIYIKQFDIDFYSQFYTGYYLSNGNQILANGQSNTVKRPDISTKDISLVCQYVFNDRHFSFNGPFFQNEIQKKTAGSFQLGVGFYHNDGHADSSFIPSLLKDPSFFHGYHFNGFGYTGLGAIGGYAYTFVYHKHYFLTGSLTAGIGIGDAVISNTGKDNRLGPEYMANGKFAAGYTNDKYFVGITYIRLVTEMNSVAPHTFEQESTGNFRFTVAKRFRIKKDLIPKTNIIKID